MSFDEIKADYVGKEIKVETKEISYTDSAGTVHTFSDYETKDSLLIGLKDDLESIGYTTRVVLPGQAVTCDYRTDRVNVQIVNQDDKFIIANLGIG